MFTKLNKKYILQNIIQIFLNKVSFFDPKNYHVTRSRDSSSEHHTTTV